jgi:hypothetical protein
MVGDLLGQGKLDLLWLMLLIAGLAIYLTLMILKKKTTLLDVEGR